MTLREQHAAMSYLIDEYIDYLQKRSDRWSETTVDARERILRRLHDYLPAGVAYAKAVQIEAFYAQGHRLGWGRWTLRNYDTHFRGFYKWADEEAKLDGNVMLKVRRPKPGRFRPKPLSREQVLRALQAPEPWRTVFALAYYEGMRAAEIAACHAEHITEDTTYIPRGKGGLPGHVPTHPVVWELIKNRTGPLLVVGPRGGVVTPHWVSQGARRVFQQLGMPGAHAHQLRHSYATHMIEEGADIRTVQELMRHASMATTGAYIESTGRRQRLAVATLVVGAPASL